ncbi:MAG: Glutamate--cysteine ligase [Gammaproteobacteria bacterium]|nr:Glutamate--cysteine ligase [Gammaproteobacteria bacterium]
MGEDIKDSHFSLSDFTQFKEALKHETELLRGYFNDERFIESHPVAGYELETWLVDKNFNPYPCNEHFLSSLDESLAEWIVPELARFNIELNAQPWDLRGDVLTRISEELGDTWSRASSTAQEIDARLVMIGILPAVQRSQLTLESMSDRDRYRALNEQVFLMRGGEPVHLHVEGVESLDLYHDDVMLESAATSLQVHIQVNQTQAASYFNAAVVLAAPIVAATGNSPFLFGKDLWTETRIPLFEQSVNTRNRRDDRYQSPARVTFGDAYLQRSLLELFNENLEKFPVLLPFCSDERGTALHHLRLHNGTIWRWNRPLLGIDAEGAMNLRIEHRAIGAGPTVLDTVANAALFWGLVHVLAESEYDWHEALSFAEARNNFYRCARLGLEADVHWLGRNYGSVRSLLIDVLLPMARKGLLALDVDETDVDRYLGIVERRLNSNRTGAQWQRDYVRRHGRDMAALTHAYWQHQESGKPVADWQWPC